MRRTSCVGLTLVVSLLWMDNAAGQVRITHLSPTSGVAGAAVRIHGVGFTPFATTVEFGNVPATVNFLRSNLLVAQVPAGASPGYNSVKVIVGSVESHPWPFSLLIPTVGTQNFVEQTPSRIPFIIGVNNIISGDIDGDLDPDLFKLSGELSGESNMLLVNHTYGHYADETVTRLIGADLTGFSGKFCDVDNDGDFDLVVIKRGGHSNQLFLNDGHGHFAEAAGNLPPLLGDISWDIACGDIDNDGDVDLVVANFGTGSLNSILLVNDGSGVFTDQTAKRGLSGVQAYSVDVGDIDNDGDLDIMFGGANSVSLFVNDGAGDFSNLTSTRLPPSPGQTLDVLFVDVDNDEDLDIFLPKTQQQSQLLINNGLGFFSDEMNTRFPVNVWCSRATAGDIDGDGDLDLVMNNNLVFLNDGSGVFSFAGEQVLPRYHGGTTSLDLADVNGDGYLDLISVKGGLYNPSRLYIGSTEEINRAPILPCSHLLLRPDDNFSIRIPSADPDGDLLTLGAFQLPANATLNRSNGLFKWKPSFNDKGLYRTYLFAQDAKLGADLRLVSVLVDPGTHDLNDIRMLVTADGQYANETQTGEGGYGFFPKGTCNQYIYAAGPWLGGTVNDTRIVAESQYQTEYVPSDIGTTGERFRVFNSSIPRDVKQWPPEFSTSSGKPKIVPGAQNLVVQYSDVNGTPLREIRRPLGVEIRQRSLAYPDAAKRNALFIVWEVKNISTDEAISDAYFGFWSDPDIGVADEGDNRTSIVQDVAITWNNDFSVPGVSEQPAIVGFSFLETPNDVGVRNYTAFTNGGPNSDPHSDAVQYDFLSRNSHFETNWRGDVRMLLSTGPFNLSPSQSVVVAGAIIFGRAPQGTTMLAVDPNTLRPDPNDPVLTDLLYTREEVQKFYDEKLKGSGLPKQQDIYADDEDAQTIPEEYGLSQNHPNPFNPETEIRFQLPEASHVFVRILNTLGEEIRTIVDAPYEAGYHRVRWDGKDKNGNPIASGVYLYQLQVVDRANGGTGTFSQVRKMTLLR